MPYSSLVDLLLLGAMWGASYLFIKVGVSEIGPLTFAMLRTLIGSIVLLAIIRLRRLALPRGRSVWRVFLIMGLLGIAIPYAAISWGTQYIASGLSAILTAAMPLFTFPIAVLWGDEIWSSRRGLGVLIGFGGILVLTWPDLQGGLQATLLGKLAIVLAALSYSVAIVLARHRLADQPPLIASLGQVSAGWLLLLPLSLLERPWLGSVPSLPAIGSVLAVGVLGTGFAYVLYYRLIQQLGATAASLVAYILPLFGVFWGWSILGERLSWNAFLALFLILAGMVLVNKRRPPLDRAARSAVAQR